MNCPRLPRLRTRTIARIVLLAAAVAGLIAPGATVSGPSAFAQSSAQRIVQGKVVDKSAAALKGAVVYLKDGHTLSVKSFISTDDGGYRFGQLAQNTDYEIWAESNGKKSAVKTISSFDSKNQFTITLTIDTAK